MRLRELSPEEYVSEVLPLTAPLWAGRRTFDEYVTQTLEIARSAYGQRCYRTIGLYDGKGLVTSFKRYVRSMHFGESRLRALGIGAVFTPEEQRGRGYASVLLGMTLDRARKERYDLAYLFSDIRPQFYANIGFRELPSRGVTLRADALPANRLDLAPLGDDDWAGVRRVYQLCEQRREAGFARSRSVWDWIQTRIHHGAEHALGQETNLVVRRGRAIEAYVFGVRSTERDTYIVDEYGFADDAAAAAIPALLRAAAGDLRRVAGWMPPTGARRLLPHGVVRKRKRAILMMAPLTAAGANLVRAIHDGTGGDFCWPTDHI